MDYNTSRKKLVMPEYGRNIQNMANHIMTIENRDERNQAARTIIDVMGNLYPYLRDIPDFKHKLWDHLAIMTDFKLDIDYPYELPTESILNSKPLTVPYNNNPVKFRHYGKMVEMMITKAVSFPEGPEKDLLIKMIADHMKKSYLQWNKETVSDETIIDDFKVMSNGKLEIPADFHFSEIRDQPSAPRSSSSSSSSSSNISNKRRPTNPIQQRRSSQGQQNNHRRY